MALACPRPTSHPPRSARRPTACGKRWFHPATFSPTIWGDYIFVTAVENSTLVVIALRRRDGTLLWRQRAPSDQLEKVHPFSNPAASTPATDGQRVYTYFGSYGLLAHDFTGKEVWQKPLPAPPTQYGAATSPIVFDGKVILQLDGNDGRSELLAFDARTGDPVWRTPRPLLRESWSTPIVWTHDGRDEIITVGTNRLTAYSASDGAERWWVGGLTLAPITCAVLGEGMLFASATGSGSPSEPLDIPRWDTLVERYDANKDAMLAVTELPREEGIHLRREVAKDTPGNFLSWPRAMTLTDGNKDGVVTKGEWEATLAFLRSNEDNVLAIRPGGSGDSSNSHVAWKASRGISEMPSRLFYRGRLYFVRNGGMVTSHMPDSGRVVLDRQRLGTLGQYVASPVAADGRIYAASETGTIVVFRAGDALEVLARNDLGESITATPAIADHKLYVRTAKHLWAFGS
ncbi:MAG TPA: PQQ-binding-like beta-propeller repeat protein [Vicinamibacterales bacterium]|nr:PQQ-binding-like beta-propeller repeat protein [Vicinamibacterales bacterium]